MIHYFGWTITKENGAIWDVYHGIKDYDSDTFRSADLSDVIHYIQEKERIIWVP